MKNGAVALSIAESILAMRDKGFINAQEDFDANKFDNIASDAELVATVEVIFEKHGAPHVPDKIQKVINAIPLLASLIQ